MQAPVTLRGGADAVLDARGQGSALVIAADDVAVEGFSLTGSAQTSGYASIWGPAGVRVEGNRARLEDLTVTGNDWGILFLGGADSSLVNSVVADNAATGTKQIGGHGHRVSNNRIERNRIGISVSPRYGDATTEEIRPEPGDMEAARRNMEMRQNAEPAEDIVLEGNVLRGNGHLGLYLDYRTRRIEVLANQVLLTGREREPDWGLVEWDLAWHRRQWAGESLDEVFAAAAGTGIMLTCLTEDDRVIGNHSHDNLGRGWS